MRLYPFLSTGFVTCEYLYVFKRDVNLIIFWI